jgi:Uma2 family endonuclease
MRLQGRFRVRIQLPLALSDDSEPEPDVAVVAPGDYEDEHPTSARLVIEISDSTLKRDRIKTGLYASAGIVECWIVNLGARAIEVYSSPDGDRYAEVRTLRPGDVLRPAQLGLELAVAEILPKV